MMASESQGLVGNILFFGATGRIGKEIFEKLIIEENLFNKLAIFTSESTAKSKSEELEYYASKGVEIIVGDLTNEADLKRAYKGINVIVSALGRAAIIEQVNLIELADRTPSVGWFIPSEFGTDIEYDQTSPSEITHQKKLQVRSALEKASSLNYTYIVTGPYADATEPAYLGTMPKAPRIGSFNVKTKKAILLGDGTGEISMTTTADVAKFVVATLRHPEETFKKALKVNSFTATPREILAEFERQTGGDKWEVEYTSLDELRVLESDAIAKNLPWTPIYTLRRIWTEGKTLYDKRDNDLIGASDTDDLEKAVKLAISQQSAT